MIIAGTRPPEYDAALRAERVRRAAAEASESEKPDGEQQEAAVPESGQPERSAVDIAPRPPSD